MVRAAPSASASLRASSPLALVRLDAYFSMFVALLAREILWGGSRSSCAPMALEALMHSASAWDGAFVGGACGGTWSGSWSWLCSAAWGGVVGLLVG